MSKSPRKRAGVRFALVLLSVFLFLFLFAPAASAAGLGLGDVNEDGFINVIDVTWAMKHVIEIETLSVERQALADVNGDGDVKIGDVTLIMQYVLGIIDEFPVPATLAVTSVKAVNLREIEILFNRTLKAAERAEAVKFSNIEVYKQGALTTDIFTAGSQAAATVLADNRTVRVTLKNNNHLTNHTTANRIVVKKEVGMTADYVKSDLAVSDTTVPTLVSVESIGTQKIALTFSEVLDSTVAPSNILLNDGAVPLDLAGHTYIDSQRQLVLNTLSAIPSGSNNLKINAGTSLRDAAQFNVVPVSMNFTHTPITAAPTVSVKASTEFTVTLEFSRMIDPATLVGNTNVLFTHTFNTALNQVNGTAVLNPSGDQKTYVVTFVNPLPPGTATVWLKYTETATDAQKIKDFWGNIVAPTSFSVTTTPDTAAPTATVTPVAGSNTLIDIQYSKTVQQALAMNASNYILRKGTTTLGFSGPVSMGNNRYRITADLPMQGTHTLTIQNIKDTTVAENPMGTQTYTFNVSDIIPPTVSQVMANNLTIANANTLYIFYSEAMGISALDRNNYRLVNTGGTQYNLPDGTSITQIGSTVRIVLPNTLGALQASLVSPTALNQLFIGEVKDLAGNIVNPMGNRTIVAEGKFNASPTSVTVHSTTQVSFIVGRHLQAVDATQIRRTVAPVQAIAPAAFVNNADGTATVTLNFPVATFTTGITGQSLSIEEDALTDIFGFKNDDTYELALGTPVNITVDRAAPVLLRAETMDVSGNGQIDRIAFIYSESIYPGSVSATDYEITGYSNVGTVTVSAERVEVAVTKNAPIVPDTGATPQVRQVGSVDDNIAPPRNTLEPQPAITAVDAARPVMISAITTSPNTIEITYSENIASNNSATAQGQYVCVVVPDVGVVTNIAVDGNKLTITLTNSVLVSGDSYEAATITYTQVGGSSHRTKDTAAVPNDARSPQVLIGISSGF